MSSLIEISFAFSTLSSLSIKLRRIDCFSRDSSATSGMLKKFKLFLRLWLSSRIAHSYSNLISFCKPLPPFWSAWIAPSWAAIAFLNSAISVCTLERLSFKSLFCFWRSVSFSFRSVQARKWSQGRKWSPNDPNFSKTNERPAKRNAGQCLAHVNKPACAILSCFDNVRLSRKFQGPFFPAAL